VILTYAGLAAGFGISESACWREVREGISVLADRGRRISLAGVARLAARMGWDYLIVDGVHAPPVTFGRKTAGQRALLLRQAQAARAERADRVPPERGTAAGRQITRPQHLNRRHARIREAREKLPGTREENQDRTCQTGTQPAITQDERSSVAEQLERAVGVVGPSSAASSATGVSAEFWNPTGLLRD
jgi:hypothetical protein